MNVGIRSRQSSGLSSRASAKPSRRKIVENAVSGYNPLSARESKASAIDYDGDDHDVDAGKDEYSLPKETPEDTKIIQEDTEQQRGGIAKEKDNDRKDIDASNQAKVI